MVIVRWPFKTVLLNSGLTVYGILRKSFFFFFFFLGKSLMSIEQAKWGAKWEIHYKGWQRHLLTLVSNSYLQMTPDRTQCLGVLTGPKPLPMKSKRVRVVQYTRSVTGHQTGDGSWQITTTRHHLSVCHMSAIECCPPHLFKYLWRHYFKTRNIVTLLFLVYLCYLHVITIHHEPSSLLTTRYRSGVLDIYKKSCTDSMNSISGTC